MKLQIDLKVFISAQSEKPCFERILTVDGYFDYQSIVCSMFQLFGDACLVEFDIVK